MKGKPHWAAWPHLISRSNLRAADRHTAIALLQWADSKTGELYPSVTTIANALDRTRRFVQHSLRRLEAAGFIEVKWSAGGRCKSHRMRLRFELLKGKPGAPLSAAKDNAPTTRRKPRTQVRKSAKAATRNGAHGSPEPSIHLNQRKQTKTADSVLRTQGWMDGEDLRSILLVCGVRGPMLDRLAASPAVTNDLVQREWGAIERDKGVRNTAAVLVDSLCRTAGIQTRGESERLAAPLVAAIERRHRE